MLGRSLSLKKKASVSDLSPSTAVADGVPAAVAEEGGELNGAPSDEKHAPTGLVNDGNTCYLNSVFQSLIHSPPLSSLLTPLDCKDGPWSPPSTYVVDRQRSPAFMAERNEHRDLMPLAAAFIESSGRSWRTELAGLEVNGGERKSQGLKTLLYTISKKYDQYADYDQQDSHELLRHLLDSMRMEEVDVIKRMHPPPGAVSRPSAPSPAAPEAPLARQPTPTPSPSSDPNALPPTNGDVSSPEKKRDSRISFVEGPHKDLETQEPLVSNVVEPEPHDMMSFVDMLFGGRLASMIVCETCKSVSHTYEDFMDLSMGLPQEEPKERKRDRFKALTQRLRGKSISRPNEDDGVDSSAVASDEDDEASDHKLFGARRLTSGAESLNSGSAPVSRRGSTVGGNESGGANLGRRNSIFSGFTGLGISRKKSVSSRRSSNAQSEMVSRPSSPSFVASDMGDDSSIPPLSNAPTLNSIKTAPPQFSNVLDPKFPKVKPSQAAYIRQILGTAPNPHPLASLHLPPTAEATVQGWMGLPPTTQNGLMDALRQFTSVEVLEGENSFACKKCWRWENPRSDGRPWRRGGETGNDADDEDGDDEDDTAPATHLPEATASVPTSVETTPSSSAVDLTASFASAPGALPSAATTLATPSAPLTKSNLSHLDTSFPDDPSADSLLSPTPVLMSNGQVIPTISTIPFSPESENPPSISTTAASSFVNGASDPTHLSAPKKESRKVNLRPAASRGLSYTRHVNPAFQTSSSNGGASSGESDFSEDGSSAEEGSFEASTDDDSAVSDGVSPAAAGAEGAEAGERPKLARKKSKKRYVMRRAFKRYLIVNPPPILVLHLKRFELIQGRGFGFGTFAANFKKIDTPLSFPLSIDVAPFLAPARIGAPVTVGNSTARKRAGKQVVDKVQYDLTAIVVHIGAMGSGHYVSYVLSSPDDPPAHHADPTSDQPPAAVPIASSDTSSHRSSHSHASSRHSHSHEKKEKDPRVWWYCSDTLVKQVPVDEVLKAKAYLLFFQKV